MKFLRGTTVQKGKGAPGYICGGGAQTSCLFRDKLYTAVKHTKGTKFQSPDYPSIVNSTRLTGPSQKGYAETSHDSS